MIDKSKREFPYVTSQMERLIDFTYYSIGKIKNSIYLLLRLPFFPFIPSQSEKLPETHKRISLPKLSNFLTYITSKERFTNDNIIKFYGIYLDNTTLLYYLVFENPGVRLSVFSLQTPQEKKLNLIYQFYHFITEAKKEEVKNFLFNQEYIFINQRGILKFLHFGKYVDCLPELKWAIDNIRKYIYEKYQKKNYLATDLNSMKVELWKMFTLFIFGGPQYFDNNYCLYNLTKKINKIGINEKISDDIPLEINKLLISTFTKIKEYINLKEDASIETLITRLIKYKSQNENNNTESILLDNKDDEDNLNLVNKNFEEISYVNEWKDMGGILNDKKFFEDRMNFMIRNFPPNYNSEQITRYHYFFQQKDLRSKFLSPRRIPKNLLNVKRDRDREKKKEEEEIYDKLYNFKYEKIKKKTEFIKVFDPKKIQKNVLNSWFEKAKSIWPKNIGCKFSIDKALKFLDLCNYDIYKSLFYIERNDEVFAMFINSESQNKEEVIEIN